MRKLLAYLLLLTTSASAQVYQGSAGGWVTNNAAGEHCFRNFGTVDAAGNYAYRCYVLYPGVPGYTEAPPFRAARLIISRSVLYAQYGDGTCAELDLLGTLLASACPTPSQPHPPAPLPPSRPPPLLPVASATPPPVTGVKVLNIVVVPLRYQSAPSNSAEAIQAYNATLPKITQAALQATFVPIAAWWEKVTYGRQRWNVNALSAVSIPGNPNCNWSQFRSDAAAAAASADAKYDVLVAIAPYSCWSSKGATSGNTVVIWGDIADGQGMLAHEIGHALGLLHNASMMPTYAEYGSGIDQMGAGSDFLTLRSLAADHRNRLGVLHPLPCASATLRSVIDFPDAIQCGSYFVDFIGDWHNEVWVHLREYRAGSRGGSDTTDYAHLAPGQSYSGEGYTFTYNGNGRVTVKAR